MSQDGNVKLSVMKVASCWSSPVISTPGRLTTADPSPLELAVPRLICSVWYFIFCDRLSGSFSLAHFVLRLVDLCITVCIVLVTVYVSVLLPFHDQMNKLFHANVVSVAHQPKDIRWYSIQPRTAQVTVWACTVLVWIPHLWCPQQELPGAHTRMWTLEALVWTPECVTPENVRNHRQQKTPESVWCFFQ